MSRVLDPQVDRNRTSMSRALGAAFLSHQVAELERNAGNQRNKHTRGRGGRARRSDRTQEDYDPDFDRARTKATFGINNTPAEEDSWRRRPQSSDDTASESASPPRPRIPLAHHRHTPLADVIVVDASVLIHALGAVQRWCHDGQTEVVIPLEALNTLDVLKSGTNQTAVRSRAASRVLEDEVGNNPRIRVQRDDAFVPWDSIAAKSATGASSTPNQPDTRWKVEGAGAPEWMKRMVCCAKWEAGTGNPDGKRVIFAVVDAKDTAASGRYDNLVDGELVSEWSTKLGLEVVKVDKEKPAGSPTKGERRTRGGGGGGRSGGGPQGGRNRGRGTLVEKPTPAIPAPPAGKVIRVLARGEKLEPE